MNPEKEIKRLNCLYDIENKGVYEYSFNPSVETASRADFLSKNFHKMDDVEMRRVMASIVDIKTVKRELLKYELKYFERKPKTMTLSKFEIKAQKLLNRYQHKAGGFRLEDKVWLIHHSNSNDHDVKANEILFENTINDNDYEDVETNEYLTFLTKQLSKIAKNIDVDIRFKNPEKGHMVGVLIWCTDTTVTADSNNGPDISL